MKDDAEIIRAFAPGTGVRMAGDIDATIQAINLNAQGVNLYQVVWWSGRTRNEAWVWPNEIEVVGDARPMRVGFVVE